MLGLNKVKLTGHRRIGIGLLWLVVAGLPSHMVAQETAPWWKNLFQGASATPAEGELGPTSGGAFAPALPASSEPVDPPASSTEVNSLSTGDSNATSAIEGPKGALSFQCDARVLQLDSAWHAAVPPMRGFRLQVFTGSLQESREMRSAIRKSSPDAAVYLSAMPPIYRVTIGDYRTKWDAQRAQDAWATAFPNALIVPMEINLPPLPGSK